MVVLIQDNLTKDDVEKAREEYGDYVKVVADTEAGLMTIGGEWHADGEKVLLESGSHQKNLWGGGIDLETGTVETMALINLRPGVNESQEILDDKIRNEVIKLIINKFAKWIDNKH